MRTRAKKSRHPVPNGWRRLRAGEILRAGDIGNSLCNDAPYDGVSDIYDPSAAHGFIPVEDLRDIGKSVRPHDLLAWYRRKKKK